MKSDTHCRFRTEEQEISKCLVFAAAVQKPTLEQGGEAAMYSQTKFADNERTVTDLLIAGIELPQL